MAQLQEWTRTGFAAARQQPWWEDSSDKGSKTRAGFLATGQINRHDFGVSWNNPLDAGGIVVGNDVYITVDAEAILDA